MKPGQQAKFKATVRPSFLAGHQVIVRRISRRTGDCTVEFVDRCAPYRKGDQVLVARYDLEPIHEGGPQ